MLLVLLLQQAAAAAHLVELVAAAGTPILHRSLLASTKALGGWLAGCLCHYNSA
jgi:hypothetical protein